MAIACVYFPPLSNDSAVNRDWRILKLNSCCTSILEIERKLTEPAQNGAADILSFRNEYYKHEVAKRYLVAEIPST
jgi:hypothetical protein